MNHRQTNTNTKPYYIYLETEPDFIRTYNAAPECIRTGTCLSRMRVEGQTVPGIRLEVNKDIYEIFKREQWMEEYRYRSTNRCIISGQCGKARCCPHGQSYRPHNSHLLFSSLSSVDEHGNEEAFDPQDTTDISSADKYLALLGGWINYIKKYYPKYDRYTELLELLGHDYALKEAAEIMNRPQRTLYGWLQTLRPIFEEYRENIG